MGTRKLPMKNKCCSSCCSGAECQPVPGAMAAEMKEYTLEEADRLTDLYRYDGYQADIPGTDFTMWYRDTMLDVEITEEGQSQGYLMASIGPECMLSVKLLDENISLEDYTKRVQEGVSPSAEIQKVNDVDFAIYDEPENEGVFCRWLLPRCLRENPGVHLRLQKGFRPAGNQLQHRFHLPEYGEKIEIRHCDEICRNRKRFL